jgi:hypothetical protein
METDMDHEHEWLPMSSHRVSLGVVEYVGCSCGTFRVDEYEVFSPTGASKRLAFRCA